MAGLTYNTYVEQLAELSVVPIVSGSNPVTTQDDNFNVIIPSAIEYGELRIYRDLDLLSTVSTNTSFSTSPTIPTLQITQGAFVTIQNVNVVSPAGTTNPNSGTRIPLLPVAKEYLQYTWPSISGSGTPQYFAMVNQNTFQFGPWPDGSYTLEIVGTVRPETLSSSNTTTFISQYLPDIFLMASMIYVSGYQRNFGKQADDPAMAQSYEVQYQTLLKGATVEEYRKKFSASAWSSISSSPVATPARG